MVKISVIVAAYNTEKYLSETIQSVLNQTFTDWELIIVNDGSTDKTQTIAKEFEAKDERIKVLSQKNQGPSVARNNGISQAKGNYISFLDADDILHKNRLKEHLNFMEKNNLDFSYCDMMLFYPDGSKEIKEAIDFKENFGDNLIKASKKQFDLKMRPGFHLSPVKEKEKVRTIFGGGYMIKKSAFKKIKFDENLKRMEDHDLWFQAIGARLKISRFPKAYYFYRSHPNQISKDTISGDKAAILINQKLKSGKYFR